MKINRLICIIVMMFFLASCSAQTRVSPQIFINRIEKNYPEFVFKDEGFYLNDCFYIFAEFGSSEIAFKTAVDKDNAVYKISLSFGITADPNEISRVIIPVISVFSPEENAEKIVGELINDKNGFYYSFGKEHSYSLSLNGNNVYFEVFNNSLSGYKPPELTLKPNDKLTF